MDLDRTLRSSGSALLLALLVITSPCAKGQDNGVDPAADPIELLKVRIAAADSALDAVAGATARLEMAALVKPYQALRATQEAAALLDGAGIATELAMRAHRELADRYTGMKAMDKAAREWAEVARLLERSRSDALSTLEKAQLMNAVANGRIDSLTTALDTERAAAKNALAAVVADHEHNTNMALMAIAGGLVALLLSVLFFTLHIRRSRARIKELQQEVTWLRLVTKRAAEPAAGASVATNGAAREVVPPVLKPEPPPAPSAGPRGPINPEEDAMLLALVRRRGEERLLTLRDARQRGDHEKVVRVVHSLKPQLVSLDAPYFTELCGRLVTSDPEGDPAQWAADLDRFEAGMARVLRPRA